MTRLADLHARLKALLELQSENFAILSGDDGTAARSLLAGADAAGLEQMFSTARDRRDAWLESLLPPGE